MDSKKNVLEAHPSGLLWHRLHSQPGLHPQAQRVSHHSEENPGTSLAAFSVTPMRKRLAPALAMAEPVAESALASSESRENDTNEARSPASATSGCLI